MQNDNEKLKNNNALLSASILFSAIIIAGAWVYTAGLKATPFANVQKTQKSVIEEKVLPSEGIVLPIHWNDLGAKMIKTGVIDGEKFEELYASPVRNYISNGASRGGLDNETRSLLYGESNGNIRITSKNSGAILNLFWALGLGNKNDILEKGPMTDMRYGGPQNFASTAGWTIAQGNPMDHYSKHEFVVLTPEKQQVVEQVAKNIYRPCCDNPTYFPDCNHGMAMLGLLELMAAEGISEAEMYKVALQVNAYWFPDTYLTIAQYLASKGIDWDEAHPKEILGANYSSGSGYQRILSQVTAPVQNSGGGCGV